MARKLYSVTVTGKRMGAGGWKGVQSRVTLREMREAGSPSAEVGRADRLRCGASFRSRGMTIRRLCATKRRR